MLVKKYGNRRLYDTAQSRYITLEELAESIKGGADVTVVDAKTQRDLTQATLAQIVIESRGATRLLPVPLLVQLIRLGDDALVEFFGSTMTWALETYLQARHGAAAFGGMNPFMPWSGAIARPAQTQVAKPVAAPPDAPVGPTHAHAHELAEIRRDIATLRRSLAAAPARKRKKA